MSARRAEVVVVGSGPAGAAAAHALVGRGVDVVMLEAGQPPPSDRFAVMERAFTGAIPWTFDPVPYEMIGDDLELNVFAIRKLGGSSLAWGAVTPRYQPNDLRMRSRYGVARDWPIAYEELEPYYGRAERLMGVAGAADSPWTPPRSEPYPMGPFPMNDTDRLVKGACARLGIPLHSVPVARNSEPYDGRSVCTYYGVCRACPIGAMYTSDRTVSRLVERPNFRLVTEAVAQRVEVDGAGRVRRVVYLDAAGREQRVDAPRVVLAAQCVENVRILLASSTGAFPHGLANNGGRLGLELMEHPKFYMTGRVKQRLDPYRQGFETATTFMFHDHARRGEHSGGRLLVRENAGPSPARLALESGLWGRALKEEIRELVGRYVTLGAFLEQLPYEDNRIALSSKVRQRGGAPAARVEFELEREYERRGYLEMKRTMERIFDALGAEEVEVTLPPSNSGHYMGGHAMGDDPATSVTDADLEAHEVKGLYLASGGAFPSSGVSNPTLTTVALALRMADRMLAPAP
ncbi:GMC family oxidoreductase [Sorangium sp. So ce854]|uniref:GMC family oxidoreductase n=1 Tax=Sorangium sp. So ce854 TaxID=3133322 RepID=UPI003F606EE6